MIETREQENPLFVIIIIIVVIVFLVFFFHMGWYCRRSDGTNDKKKKTEVIALIEKYTSVPELVDRRLWCHTLGVESWRLGGFVKHPFT
jgi:heme/copper-type cytochrome/quinol oxidase subunit 2